MRALGHHTGTTRIPKVRDDEVVRQSREARLRGLRGMLADLPGDTWSDELIEDRQAEAKRESPR